MKNFVTLDLNKKNCQLVVGGTNKDSRGSWEKKKKALKTSLHKLFLTF